MSELGDKRKIFTRGVALLIMKMTDAGFNPMLGKDGLPHKKDSLHFEGLAVDIDLCDSKGNYLSDTESHRQFGEWWKGQHKDFRWGGDFSKPDGNHYSITFGGRL